MIDMSIKYMGIPLKSPIVASSAPLWAQLDNVKKMEDAGGAAVVLPSLFEEQVIFEEKHLNANLQRGTEQFAESLSYLPDIGTYTFKTTQYLEHIQRCKQAVNIPIIGSLNGISRSGWLRFAREIQDAGADGLELNIYFLPVDPRMSSEEVESNYIGLVHDVVKTVKHPCSGQTESISKCDTLYVKRAGECRSKCSCPIQPVLSTGLRSEKP
jgi:dihydroorotate dehydrogenase (fumarate)